MNDPRVRVLRTVDSRPDGLAAIREVVDAAREITWFDCAGPGTPLNDAKLKLVAALARLDETRGAA